MEFLGLSKGYVAVVDEADYGRLAGYRWHAVETRNNVYGARVRRVKEAGAGEKVWLHREVMGLRGEREWVVDHINGQGLDCRRGNLRICTRSENGANRRATGRGSSRYKGVQRVRGRAGRGGGWAAVIKVRGRKKWLGCYGTELEAVKAYNVWAVREFGRFARLNVWAGETEAGCEMAGNDLSCG